MRTGRRKQLAWIAAVVMLVVVITMIVIGAIEVLSGEPAAWAVRPTPMTSKA